MNIFYLWPAREDRILRLTGAGTRPALFSPAMRSSALKIFQSDFASDVIVEAHATQTAYMRVNGAFVIDLTMTLPLVLDRGLMVGS